MRSGKYTAYDHDTRLPFVVVPPDGVEHVSAVEALVSNVDLYPTILEIAGGGRVTDRDGRSMLALIGGVEVDWRKTIYLEFRGGGVGPDAEVQTKVPPFLALRTSDYLYVDWSSSEDGTPPTGLDLEFYRLTGENPDTAEVHNLSGEVGGPTTDELAALEATVRAFAGCSGVSCWEAGLIDPLDP